MIVGVCRVKDGLVLCAKLLFLFFDYLLNAMCRAEWFWRGSSTVFRTFGHCIWLLLARPARSISFVLQFQYRVRVGEIQRTFRWRFQNKRPRRNLRGILNHYDRRSIGKARAHFLSIRDSFFALLRRGTYVRWILDVFSSDIWFAPILIGTGSMVL